MEKKRGERMGENGKEKNRWERKKKEEEIARVRK